MAKQFLNGNKRGDRVPFLRFIQIQIVKRFFNRIQFILKIKTSDDKRFIIRGYQPSGGLVRTQRASSLDYLNYTITRSRFSLSVIAEDPVSIALIPLHNFFWFEP